MVTIPTDSITPVGEEGRKKKKCPMCHKHFREEFLAAHVAAHVKERHLKCPTCDKSYFNLVMLRKHMKVHNPEKYGKKCRLCEKVFLISDKLLTHERYCVKKALENSVHIDPEIMEDLSTKPRIMSLSQSIC